MDEMPTVETGLGTLIITGSSGLIGSAFLDHVGECYRELCLDPKRPPRVPPKTAHVIPCDLTSDENLHQALDEVRRLGHRRIASILHLAAYYSFASESSPLYEHVNVHGTERLLHGLRDFLVRELPNYARPLFIRIQPAIETTGTFKYRKVDLVRDGFDPSKTEFDLYFDHPLAHRYERLNRALYEEIQSGAFKL